MRPERVIEYYRRQEHWLHCPGLDRAERADSAATPRPSTFKWPPKQSTGSAPVPSEQKPRQGKAVRVDRGGNENCRFWKHFCVSHHVGWLRSRPVCISRPKRRSPPPSIFGAIRPKTFIRISGTGRWSEAAVRRLRCFAASTLGWRRGVAWRGDHSRALDRWAASGDVGDCGVRMNCARSRRHLALQPCVGVHTTCTQQHAAPATAMSPADRAT